MINLLLLSVGVLARKEMFLFYADILAAVPAQDALADYICKALEDLQCVFLHHSAASGKNQRLLDFSPSLWYAESGQDLRNSLWRGQKND